MSSINNSNLNYNTVLIKNQQHNPYETLSISKFSKINNPTANTSMAKDSNNIYMNSKHKMYSKSKYKYISPNYCGGNQIAKQQEQDEIINHSNDNDN